METTGFVPEPNCGRGTLGIVWACLPTVAFVLYTAIHKDAHRSMPRSMWALFVFFVPESMPASAIDQLIKASRLKKRLRALQGWQSWTLKQSFLVVKRGVREADGGDIITPNRLVELAERHQYLGDEKYGLKGGGVCMDMLPSGDAIDRRSKKGWFEKLLAGCQALWFCANIVSRLVEGYTVTPLEDLTIAYTCCGLIATLAWLRCPQDISESFEVDLDVVDDGVLAAVECGHPLDEEPTSINATSGSSSTIRPTSPVTGSDWFMMTTVCVVLSLLAAIHMAEWNYAFPSAAEAWIWRCCSVAMLPIGLLILFFGDRCRSKHWSTAWTAPAYVVVRLALLTIAVTSFRQVPLSALDTPDWSDYWGHFGK
ncbi:hypothetical protein KVR01_004827 [Diaporthe batatas]|uniref:uncharacterized protein n=1 Tax=Diaporthe batatas TaxID=748121 RepID=UPI001D04849F|nr:uncharacterized protein KVR01_004827 [Diaporthe batatas]KAG8166275.1 hypothetical protein KVR01_004827 [Diaporthe batatas]